jgi:hypothetical protein
MNDRAFPTPIKFLGILFVVLGTSLILSGLGLFVGAFSQIPSDPEDVFTFRFAVGRYFVLVAAGIVLGAGLLEGKRWAWFGAFSLGILALIKFPTGTVIGGIVLFILFRSNARAFFRIRMPGSAPPG